MRVADLKQAQALVDERATAAAMIARIDGSEPLALTIGEGPARAAIHLTAGYTAAIRADIRAALERRLAALDAKIAEMGLET